MQTAAVVAHALYHGEGKKDSEGVGETNWVHKCTPSNICSGTEDITVGNHANVSHYHLGDS